MNDSRTPSQGLKILERLYGKNPYNKGINNELIDVYIRFGMNQQAMDMVAKIPDNSLDLQSLKNKAWLANQQNDYDTEYNYWEMIFNKQLDFIPEEDRNYLMQQTSTKPKKISLLKEAWNVLFNSAFSLLPIKLQLSLGKEIKNIVLVANNNSLTLENFRSNICTQTLIVCFNHNVFLKYHKLFPDNPKLLFFRKENEFNHIYRGLIGSDCSIHDTDSLYELMRRDNTYFLFSERKPHTLALPLDIYKKIYDPCYSASVSQFHKIFHYLEPMPFYFNQSALIPTSGFMVFRYLYYARLYLYSIGQPSFTIKLLGFNFDEKSYYQIHGVHNWDYERSQLENLPSCITRIVV